MKVFSQTLLFLILLGLAGQSALGATHCGFAISSPVAISQNPRATAFAEALSSQRPKILRLYRGRINEQQYDQLAQLAYAIMGNESTFYQGWWYWVKNWTPNLAIHAVKCVRRFRHCGHDLSQGPTQIKEIPDLVVQHYKASPYSLHSNPEHAAAATMAKLIEFREKLFHLQDADPDTLPNLNEDNLNDYIVYFYRGLGKYVLEQKVEPNPAKNAYLRKILETMDRIRVQKVACADSEPGIEIGSLR